MLPEGIDTIPYPLWDDNGQNNYKRKNIVGYLYVMDKIKNDLTDLENS